MVTLIWQTSLLGGAGAVLRFLILQACAPVSTRFPLGTLIVNIIACLGGGVFAGLDLSTSQQLLLIGGLIGGLGTLSSICSDSINLLRARQFASTLAYLLLSALCGLIAAAAGLSIGRAAA